MPSSRRGWRRSTTSAGPSPSSSTSTRPSAHFERGIAISRATGDGRLLVPLTLASAVPQEARGRLAESAEICEAAVEAARLTDNPQYLFWALWELGWRHYLMGDLEAAIDACEQSAARGAPAGGQLHALGLGRARLDAGAGADQAAASSSAGWRRCSPASAASSSPT